MKRKREDTKFCALVFIAGWDRAGHLQTTQREEHIIHTYTHTQQTSLETLDKQSKAKGSNGKGKQSRRKGKVEMRGVRSHTKDTHHILHAPLLFWPLSRRRQRWTVLRCRKRTTRKRKRKKHKNKGKGKTRPKAKERGESGEWDCGLRDWAWNWKMITEDKDTNQHH